MFFFICKTEVFRQTDVMCNHISDRIINQTTETMNFLKKIFGKSDNQEPKEFTEKEHELDYEQKSQGLENILGKMH